MKNLFEVIAGSLLYAWRKQMNIPLPRKLYKVSRGGGDWQCAGFPLLGWLLGLLIALAGALTELIFNVYAGALVFAILAWLLLFLRDSGKSDSLFAANIINRLPDSNVPMQTVVPVVLLLGRMILLVLLYVHGEMWHLPLVIGGIFTLEALLTIDGSFMPPLVDDSPESRRNMVSIAVILALVSFVFTPLATALGVTVFLVIRQVAQHKSDGEGSDLMQITLAGSGAGWALLLAGVCAI